MNPLRTGLSVLLAGATLVAPATAVAQAVVPPTNPAATQYTEAFPTSRGPTDAEHRHAHKRSPEQTLGGRNAKRLEAQGNAGKEAARVAAETAPASVGTRAPVKAGTENESGAGSKGSQAQSGNDMGAGHSSRETASETSGGSGLGNVAGQATGLGTSDGTGLLLPLALLGAIAWGTAYVVRRRRRAEQ